MVLPSPVAVRGIEHKSWWFGCVDIFEVDRRRIIRQITREEERVQPADRGFGLEQLSNGRGFRTQATFLAPSRGNSCRSLRRRSPPPRLLPRLSFRLPRPRLLVYGTSVPSRATCRGNARRERGITHRLALGEDFVKTAVHFPSGGPELLVPYLCRLRTGSVDTQCEFLRRMAEE